MPGDSEEADLQRQLVITEQMALFRGKPFVAAAVFWTYQDYRTPSDFVMGVVDAERNRRGSWFLLRDEYTPLRIESVAFAPPPDGTSSEKPRRAEIALRSRGPEDMPSYTLRGYTLQWEVASPSGKATFAEGELALPTLEPGMEWMGSIEWTEPETDYVLIVSVIRPTGFPLLEHVYDAQGVLLGREK